MNLNDCQKQLEMAGIKTSRIDALAIFEYVLGVDKAQILASNFELSSEQSTSIMNLVQARADHTPLAYLLKQKEFYGRDFYVDESVLIPRPESEALLELMFEQIKEKKLDADDNLRIIDVGTGSGCLIITAMLELSKAKDLSTKVSYWGLDISTAALKVAKRNSKNHGAKVDFIESDLLSGLDSSVLSPQSSVLLANLPYVPDGLITSEEIGQEPAIALFSGSDGLDHYRKFWGQITMLRINPKIVITECLDSQFEDLDNLAEQAGFKLSSASGLARCYMPSRH